jgi:hypothetical protein
MYKVVLLLTLAIAPTFQLSLIAEPVDNMPPAVNLANDVDVNEINTDGVIDVSAARAAKVFEKLHFVMDAGFGELTHLSHYVLNVNSEVEDNNTMLEQWRIGHDENGQRTYMLILKTTDRFNLENPVHTQMVKFQCKYEEYVEHMLCIPDKCDLEAFETSPPPGIICAWNYRQSQRFLTTVYESSHDVSHQDLGDGVYESSIDCMKKKIEKMSLSGIWECYYKGFEPDNIVSIAEMEKALLSEGWRRLENGTYERETVVEDKDASAVVNENNMTLNGSG